MCPTMGGSGTASQQEVAECHTTQRYHMTTHEGVAHYGGNVVVRCWGLYRHIPCVCVWPAFVFCLGWCPGGSWPRQSSEIHRHSPKVHGFCNSLVLCGPIECWRSILCVCVSHLPPSPGPLFFCRRRALSLGVYPIGFVENACMEHKNHRQK